MGDQLVTICREYEFDAAHQLQWHEGACRRLHGHTYRLEVEVSGPLDERGVVMDFAELDAVVRSQVLAIVDHQFLNEIIENPTAERIAEWIWARVEDECPQLSEVRLWETRRSSVRLTRAAVR